MKYYTRDQIFPLNKLIDELGELSNKEIQLFIPLTSFPSFFHSNNAIIILTCMDDIIIGFIYFNENPKLLGNHYYLYYFGGN